MNCKTCGKKIEFDEAMHCTRCGADFCPDCAKGQGFCDCYGEMKHYS